MPEALTNDLFDLSKSLGCDLQLTTSLEAAVGPRLQFGWRVRGCLGESTEEAYTTLRACLHSCMSWLKYIERQRSQANVQEIAALCQELNCAFTISSCHPSRAQALKYELRIVSGRCGESNGFVHAALDTCYNAGVWWLKKVQANREDE